MNKELQQAGIIGNDLFKVDYELVDSYNSALERIIGKKTSLKKFNIDKRGVSPEIQEELGTSYLQNGSANRYVIILSPEQRNASLVSEEFSFDDQIIDSVYDDNQSEINAISRVDCLYGKMDDGLGTYSGLEDMLMLKDVTLKLDAPSGFIDKSEELKRLIKELERNPELLIKDNSAHITKLYSIAKEIGDVRKYGFSNISSSKKINNFFTTLFGGVYVFKEDTVIYSNDITPRLKFTTPNIDFISSNKPFNVIEFLLARNMVEYSTDKIPFLLERIEDMTLLKRGYSVSKLYDEERERILALDAPSDDWKKVRKIQAQMDVGYNSLNNIMDKHIPAYIHANLLQASTNNANVNKVVSNLLCNFTFLNFEDMYKWNKKMLEETFEESNREIKEYIINKLR
ncbi:MAG: DUF6638 family protein [Candidatus Woesearchaeota archaeon]